MSWINLIGKAPVHPLLFYSGKFAGYITWTILWLAWLEVPTIKIFSYTATEYAAYTTFLAGSLLISISLINLGKSTRFGLPIEDTNLKTNGLYGRSRNPMYLGFYLWTFSAMVYTMNLWILVLGIYTIFTYHRIILGEESFLEGRFGKRYAEYKHKVPRYL
ncbi:MAG: isoprenylcysteine carboxylmethyltransferase family protein [Saprospiraceae bacterium]|nr:isoprenylcysteine carboxylmethyltransferase family protein [Saprospiraceae bacterium]